MKDYPLNASFQAKKAGYNLSLIARESGHSRTALENSVKKDPQKIVFNDAVKITADKKVKSFYTHDLIKKLKRKEAVLIAALQNPDLLGGSVDKIANSLIDIQNKIGLAS